MRQAWIPGGLAAAFLLTAVLGVCRAQQPSSVATSRDASREFQRLSSRLSAERLSGAESSRAELEQALSMLDAEVLESLNAARGSNPDSLNQDLRALVSAQLPVGEDYRVVRLGGAPPAYALVANFGLGGPSAVRVYASASGRYTLTARIDRFAQKDFFDEYLELVPVTAPTVLFVTVAGRTDDLQTGIFTAWALDGAHLKAVWTSDLLQQSSYEARPDGFRITFCAETDEENPRLCRKMTRDRYVWEGSAWRRVEQASLPVPKG